MGKVRTEKVKKTARELVKRFPDRFTGDFESNKKALTAIVPIPTIKLRNRIAGYVTRLIAISKARAESEQSEETIESEDEEET